MLVPEAPAPGAGYAQPSAGCCMATPACMRAMCSSVSGCCCVRRKSYSSSARICCCIPVELALRCCCSCCCLVLSIDGPHLIQDRQQDCLVCCVLCYPTSWINVKEVSLLREAPPTKTCLQYLHPPYAGACLSAQWL